MAKSKASSKPASSKPQPAAKSKPAATGSAKPAPHPAKPAAKGKPESKPAAKGPAPTKGSAKPAPHAAKHPAKGTPHPPAPKGKDHKPEPKAAEKPGSKSAAAAKADTASTKGAPAAKAAAPAKGTPAPKGKPEAPSAKGAPAPKAAAPTATSAAAGGGAGNTGAAAAGAPGAPGAAGAGGKVPPKGITIVSNKPVRKPKPKPLVMPVSEPLIKPGAKWKPLITSGPKAPPSSGIPGELAPVEFKPDPKAKLPAKELAKYREILLKKRAELVGDMTNMEEGALRQNSGSLSNLPQHMAEQGSETMEQTLSLELAEVDRNLIKEIDDAIRRIDAGTYGICLRTGKRISAERLAEIPWAKYSIEAAREMERRPYTAQAAASDSDED